MATRFVDIDRDTALLLPPDLRDWVPANHLVHFIIDAIEKLDLRDATVNTRGTGRRPVSAIDAAGAARLQLCHRRVRLSSHRAIDVRSRGRASVDC
jgi:hypothetical protein